MRIVRHILPATAAILALAWMALVNAWLLIIPILLGIAANVYPRWKARERLHEIIDRGDVRALLRAWRGSVPTMTHAETAIPLMIATAYAAFGWVDEARRARAHIIPGLAHEVSREQLEFIDVLLEVYEGDRDAARHRAESLAKMPVESGGRAASARVLAVRRGLLAITRAFVHQATAEDARALIDVRIPVPILIWPLRYAEAIVAVDGGNLDLARTLLASAPAWPENSVFCTFHRELLVQIDGR